MNVSTEHARELSSLFTTATLRALAAPNAWEAASRLALLCEVPTLGRTLGDVFDGALEALRRTRRSEYVFKNDIVSRLVFGKHKPASASAALEFATGSSKADVVVINGTTTAYEIKTDYDSFARLDTQLRDYSAFAECVYVVVSPDRSQAALDAAPAHVGVIALRRDGRMSTLRGAAEGLSRIEPTRLFQALRAGERAEVLDAEGVTHDGSTAGMRTAFSTLPVVSLHEHTVRLLRQRFGSAANIVSEPQFPNSLRALAYGVSLSGKAQLRLMARLRDSPAALV